MKDLSHSVTFVKTEQLEEGRLYFCGKVVYLKKSTKTCLICGPRPSKIKTSLRSAQFYYLLQSNIKGALLSDGPAREDFVLTHFTEDSVEMLSFIHQILDCALHTARLSLHI